MPNNHVHKTILSENYLSLTKVYLLSICAKFKLTSMIAYVQNCQNLTLTRKRARVSFDVTGVSDVALKTFLDGFCLLGTPRSVDSFF